MIAGRLPPPRARPPRIWPLVVTTASFLFSAANAVIYGPQSWSFIGAVVNGVLLALLISIEFPTGNDPKD